jgi:hypothetical protein
MPLAFLPACNLAVHCPEYEMTVNKNGTIELTKPANFEIQRCLLPFSAICRIAEELDDVILCYGNPLDSRNGETNFQFYLTVSDLQGFANP